MPPSRLAVRGRALPEKVRVCGRRRTTTTTGLALCRSSNDGRPGAYAKVSRAPTLHVAGTHVQPALPPEMRAQRGPTFVRLLAEGFS